MNTDGKPGRGEPSQGENTVSLLFGNGAGEVLGRTDLNVGLRPRTWLRRNADGRLDIAVGSASTRLFTVLLSLAGGVLPGPQSILTPTGDALRSAT
jgi:hypothetical protein